MRGGRWWLRRLRFMKTSSALKGRLAEDTAVVYLLGLGWHILGTWVRTPAGEIDVLARDGDDLVAVEVKARSATGWGTAAEAVGAYKLSRVLAAVAWWCADTRCPTMRIRLDLITVDLCHGEPCHLSLCRDVLRG